jgi:short-subunit dehydrogenase
MAVYYASKSYVWSFSQALREELRGTGVTVTTLCPGPTRTNFPHRAKARHIRLFSGRLADPAAVARAGYRGLWRGCAAVFPGWGSRLGAWLARVMPARIVTRYVHWLDQA